MREWLARLLEAEQGRLALWLPVAMGCGVLAFLLPRADPPAWLAWVALVPFLPAAWLARRHLLGGWLAGLCAAFGLGFALAAWHVANALPCRTSRGGRGDHRYRDRAGPLAAGRPRHPRRRALDGGHGAAGAQPARAAAAARRGAARAGRRDRRARR
jgi:hypothetical protein